MNIERNSDPQLWKAIAGDLVNLPPVNSTVYYFPQGHAEHVQFKLPEIGNSFPYIICKVESIKYLAHRETDEIYAKIELLPLKYYNPMQNLESSASSSSSPPPPAVSKTLTQSDANNGGGFSVPRSWADNILPQLNYMVTPNAQSIMAKDIHGDEWRFRHIYRGTPRRHLLTTGWSGFVARKRLLVGDSIVLVKNDINGDLGIGIRKARRRIDVLDHQINHDDLEINHDDENRVKIESFIKAISLAFNQEKFEVVYYPQSNVPEFIVNASSVDRSMMVRWCRGLKFKMPFENEDSIGISLFTGTISSVQYYDPYLYPSYPWRSLEVTWDEPEMLKHVTHVSPWSIELVSNMPPPFHSSMFSHPIKKLCLASGFSYNGQFPMGKFGFWNGYKLDTQNNIPDRIQEAKCEEMKLSKKRKFSEEADDEDDENVSCSLSLALSPYHPEEEKTVTFVLFGKEIIFTEEEYIAHQSCRNINTPTPSNSSSLSSEFNASSSNNASRIKVED